MLSTPPNLPPAPKKNATAGSTAQVEIKGFYAQALKNRKSPDDAGEDADDSSSATADVEPSAPTAKAASSSSTDDSGGAMGRIYTARGVYSNPPSLGGEVFQTIV